MDTGKNFRILTAVQHLLNTKGPSCIDPFGNTPLMWAVRDKNMEVITALVEQHQLPINTQNFDGETALSIGVQCGYHEIVKYLIERGAHVNMGNCRLETALHQGVVFGHLEIVRLLVESGGYVEAEDECGDTPLHFAVREDRRELVEYLIHVGADVNHMNHDEESPAEFAKMVGSESVRNIFDDSKNKVVGGLDVVRENRWNLGVRLPLLLPKVETKKPLTEEEKYSANSANNLSLDSTTSVWQGENSTSFPKRLTPNSNLPHGFVDRHLINV